MNWLRSLLWLLLLVVPLLAVPRAARLPEGGMPGWSARRPAPAAPGSQEPALRSRRPSASSRRLALTGRPPAPPPRAGGRGVPPSAPPVRTRPQAEPGLPRLPALPDYTTALPPPPAPERNA